MTDSEDDGRSTHVAVEELLTRMGIARSDVDDGGAVEFLSEALVRIAATDEPLSNVELDQLHDEFYARLRQTERTVYVPRADRDTGRAPRTAADELDDPAAENVRFDVVRLGDHASVVYVAGELDTFTAPPLHALLIEHLSLASLLVLDLSAVTFLGSAGIAVLVAAKDAAAARKCTLRLVVGSRIVMRALAAMGLLTLFDVTDGVAEALGSSAHQRYC